MDRGRVAAGQRLTYRLTQFIMLKLVSTLAVMVSLVAGQNTTAGAVDIASVKASFQGESVCRAACSVEYGGLRAVAGLGVEGFQGEVLGKLSEVERRKVGMRQKECGTFAELAESCSTRSFTIPVTDQRTGLS